MHMNYFVGFIYEEFKGAKSWLCSRVVPEGSLAVRQVGQFSWGGLVSAG